MGGQLGQQHQQCSKVCERLEAQLCVLLLLLLLVGPAAVPAQ
jgi:hypothetical protein